jgi:NAD(P)H dehydrogenase (quinone)
MNRVTILYDPLHLNAYHDILHNMKNGLEETNIQAILMNVSAMNIDVLAESDGIIFGCPADMGGVSLEFKKAMDMTHNAMIHQRLRDKIAAGFTFTTELYKDADSTLKQLVQFASYHGMIWVPQGRIEQNEAANIPGINKHKSIIGLVSHSSDDQPLTVPDLQTAYYFGFRIGTAVNRWTY